MVFSRENLGQRNLGPKKIDQKIYFQIFSLFFILIFFTSISFANYAEVALYIGQRDSGESISDYKKSIPKSLPKAKLLQPFQTKEHYIDVSVSDRLSCKIGILQVTPSNANGKNLVLFYGNAQNSYDVYKTMGHYRDSLLNQGYQVFIMDYPGYGLSECRPYEQTVVSSAVASFDYIQKIVKTPVTVLGFAIGGAVAAQVAEVRQKNILNLILVSTFASLKSLIEEAGGSSATLKFLAWRKGYDTSGDPQELQKQFEARNKFITSQYLQNLHLPILLLHGTIDKVIPVSQFEKLKIEIAKKQNCFEAEVLTSQKHGQLMSLDNPKYTPSFWQRISKFLNFSACS